MDLFKTISKRYSYRGGFKNKKIPKKDLKKIVQAGLDAPSGKNEQTTTFVIIDDKKFMKKISTMHAMKAMQEAKAMIVCIVDKRPQPVYEGFSFQIEDCSAAAENMLLAITALGYASVWIDGWLKLEERAEKIGKILNLPKGKVVRVLLPMGEPSQYLPRKQKKSFKERAWFNKHM